ncbi:MAG TPA: DUF1684 domain-containing protein [Vicinamibacterales bacterium]|jgi:hypothetical protein|nr:DUF1684 domain-containing protein [Vicinamibacterales bacterium]
MIARGILVVTLALSLDPAAIKEIQQFRAKHEEDYRRQFVTLSGLFDLKPGVNTVGSAAGSDVVLPPSAPARIGRLVVGPTTVRFEPVPSKGTAPMLKDRPLTSPIELTSDEKGPGDEIAVGGVSFWVHMSGDRRTIRLRDVNGAPAKAFEGFRWFPIDEKYRVSGTFIKDKAPTTVRIPNQLGDEETYTTEGIVQFVIDGQTVSLRPMTTRPGRLYFIFRDGTSGKETYETARFLYTNLNADGTTVMDFNQAYNPPCSFNPYTTCPLPPKENRLTVRIPAGEKAYPHPPGHSAP